MTRSARVRRHSGTAALGSRLRWCSGAICLLGVGWRVGMDSLQPSIAHQGGEVVSDQGVDGLAPQHRGEFHRCDRTDGAQCDDEALNLGAPRSCPEGFRAMSKLGREPAPYGHWLATRGWRSFPRGPVLVRRGPLFIRARPLFIRTGPLSIVCRSPNLGRCARLAACPSGKELGLSSARIARHIGDRFLRRHGSWRRRLFRGPVVGLRVPRTTRYRRLIATPGPWATLHHRRTPKVPEVLGTMPSRS